MTENGACCAFPFMFNGKAYDKCTSDGATSGKTWCGTKINEAGMYTEWSHCLPESK